MAARTDLDGIKTELRSLLVSANTTTASPVDLSSGLANSKRVLQILKIHPEMIRPQASFFPLVTCYVTQKDIKTEGIAGSQLNSLRRGTITMNVVGSIWNDTFVTLEEDPADEDINILMENIEWILRSNTTLNGKVNWQRPGGCKYYTTVLDQQTHIRSGILTLECEVFY